VNLAVALRTLGVRTKKACPVNSEHVEESLSKGTCPEFIEGLKSIHAAFNRYARLQRGRSHPKDDSRGRDKSKNSP